MPIRNSVDAAIGKQTDKNTSTQDEENMDTTIHVGAISADDVSDVESVTVQKEGPTNSLIQLKAPIGIKSMCSIIVCFVNKKKTSCENLCLLFKFLLLSIYICIEIISCCISIKRIATLNFSIIFFCPTGFSQWPIGVQKCPIGVVSVGTNVP